MNHCRNKKTYRTCTSIEVDNSSRNSGTSKWGATKKEMSVWARARVTPVIVRKSGFESLGCYILTNNKQGESNFRKLFSNFITHHYYAFAYVCEDKTEKKTREEENERKPWLVDARHTRLFRSFFCVHYYYLRPMAACRCRWTRAAVSLGRGRVPMSVAFSFCDR